VLAQGESVIPIPGTRRISRLQENVGAAKLELTDSDLAQLNEAPQPAEPRYAGAQTYNRR
jgi:aryl-alcohol dehydrogenase-like predicted oxidoreductase